MEREPGLYEGIPISEYHDDPDAISKSGLDEIALSPFHWWSTHLDPRRPRERAETPAQLTGNLAHCAILEYDQFARRYRVGPSVHSKNLKIWQDFKKDCEAEGATAIDQQQYDMAMRMRENVMAIPDLAALFAQGKPEVSAYWRDPVTGVLCRCRPDWMHPLSSEAVLLADVKTYSCAEEGEFARQIARSSYEVQDAYYTDGIQHASGKRVAAFLFVAVEASFPHAVNAIMLDDESRDAGRRKYRRLLDTYAECRRANSWPSYGSDIKVVSLPQWALEPA